MFGTREHHRDLRRCPSGVVGACCGGSAGTNGSLAAMLLWFIQTRIRQLIAFVHHKGAANTLVLAIPVAVLCMMMWVGYFSHEGIHYKANRVNAVVPAARVITMGSALEARSEFDPFRFCSSSENTINLIVLDENTVLPDFLSYDWLGLVMFEKLSPRMGINIIMEEDYLDNQNVRLNAGSKKKGDADPGNAKETTEEAMEVDEEKEEAVFRAGSLPGQTPPGSVEEEEDEVMHNRKFYKNIFCNNSIIVVNTKACSPLDLDSSFVVNYLHQAERLKVNVLGAIHLNDHYPDYKARKESGEQGGPKSSELGCPHTDWYKLANFVFRPFWSNSLEQRYPNLRWMPLGWRVGFVPFTSLTEIHPPLPPPDDRTHFCSFVGTFGSRRNDFLRAVKKDGRCYVAKFKSKTDSVKDVVKSYDIWSERRLMLDSAITLSPAGLNRETHRIYEALEAGSVPIIDRTEWAGYDDDAFAPFGQDCPLPAIQRSWGEELTPLLDRLRQPDKLSALQREVTEWYSRLKKEWQANVAREIEHARRKTSEAAEKRAAS